MRRLLRPVFLVLAVLTLCAAAHAAAPPARDGGSDAAPPATEGAAEKPGAIEGLKRALQAQGEVSPQTMEALKGTPMGADAPKPGQKDARPQGSTPGKKAIYGDIIIYK